jgi:diacylglycerol kinase (ATP)
MKNVDWKETLNPARYVAAIKYAIAGTKSAFDGEAAFRLEIIAFVILFPIAFYVSKTNSEAAILVGSLFLVLITELLNSAVESAVDRTGTEINPLSKRAKDIASSAVLLSIINALTIWIIILFW